MPPIQLFMAPVRWSEMLLLCHGARAVTWLRYGGALLRGQRSPAGRQRKHRTASRARDSFHVTFSHKLFKIKDDGSVGWSTHGQTSGLPPAVPPTSVSGTLYHALTFTAVARRWPFFFFSLSLSLPPCHALVLNINATLLRARHSWEQAELFLASCPQLHIYSPGAIGQLVFVSNGGRQCCNLLNANRHLDRGRLRPVRKPRTPSTCLTLHRCSGEVLAQTSTAPLHWTVWFSFIKVGVKCVTPAT